jgi:hypothetical protein
MMADMLRAMKQLPIFPALSVHMVEGATALPPLEVPRGSAQMPAGFPMGQLKCLRVAPWVGSNACGLPHGSAQMPGACAGLIARVTFDRSLTP